MIRLYLPIPFEIGGSYLLPYEELHYFLKVRRGRGPVEIFNNQGDFARGKIEGESFIVDEVIASPSTIYPVTVASALPDASIVSDLIRSVSELGVERLVFFPADRTQAGPKRTEEKPKDKNSRWEKIAIESARQCGRSPLDIHSWSKNWKDEVLEKKFERILFFDELAAIESQELKSPQVLGPVLILVGPEGGWSSAERDWARETAKIVHLPTPVLKVHTAVIAAAFLGLMNLSHFQIREAKRP